MMLRLKSRSVTGLGRLGFEVQRKKEEMMEGKFLYSFICTSEGLPHGG